VLTGVVAATQAGPAVSLSFLVAGIASAAAALCYAEFAGMIPVSGSAYGYAVLGEFFAWIIGWDLLIEYTLVVAVVAIGISGYINELLSGLGFEVPAWAASAPGGGDGGAVDLFAVLLCLFIAGIQIRGIRESANFNNVMVLIKLAIIAAIIAIGVFFVDPGNLTPFFPFGVGGVFTGAAVVFFAVFGYDTLTTAAEEAVSPQRDLPRAVILSLAIALTLYVLMSVILTGIAPYESLDNPAPVATAFKDAGLPWVANVISVAAIAGIISVLFAFMLGAARVWFAVSRDGLLPRWFAYPHPRFRTPYRPTAILGVVTALVAGFFPITAVAELVNIGVLTAFIIVCASVWILHRTRPETRRSFRTPLVPIVPLLGIIFSVYLSRAYRPLPGSGS
jgi:basic amino acid/polyamine antiporter, APA family